MARTKSAKATGVASGNHLVVTQNDDGTVDMKWNWDKLLEEVQEATKGAKINIVAVTEEKVTKTRASRKKKVD